MKKYIRTDRAVGWDPAAYRRYRIERHLSFQDIAERVGVAVSSAHRWGGARRPPKKLVASIARVLGVRQKDLITPGGAR